MSADDEQVLLNKFGEMGFSAEHIRRANISPRKLISCVKVSIFILIIPLAILLISSLTMGHKAFFSKLQQPNSQFAPIEMGNTANDFVMTSEAPFDKDAHSILTHFEHIPREKLLKNLYIINTTSVKLISSNLKTLENCIIVNGAGSKNKEQTLCLKFNNGLNCAVQAWKNKDIHCQSISWGKDLNGEKNDKSFPLNQCIELTDRWYGGGALSEHRWPLNRVNVPLQPYVTKNFDIMTPIAQETGAEFLSVLEPYFISSNGVAVVLNSSIPILMSINHNGDNKLCFQSTSNQLEYKVCKNASPKTIHEYILKTNLLSRPVSYPDSFLISPIWSTRGIDTQNMNETNLIHFIHSLKSSGLPFQTLFIDGNYSRSPENLYFNEKKFPHSAQLIGELKSDRNSLNIGVEIHPTVSALEHHKQLKSLSLQLKATESQIKDVFKSKSNFLDLSNKDASVWYISQLDQLRGNVHVSSFRFSGGNVSLNHIHNQDIPTVLSKYELENYFKINQISYEYGKIANKFKGNSILGVGFKSQQFGLVADSGPNIASWDHRKGLKSVIPTVITYGIIGYPFVMAGPIGGVNVERNASSNHFKIPDRNLFIRWLQIASFLPIMEFSVGPWQYDVKLLSYTKKLLKYRENTIWPKYLYPALKETMQTGIPVIRPLWWIAPKDTTAQFIDCEFLVGDHLLVAPVLNSNDMSRQVYLPEGFQWSDQLRGEKVLEGGQWLRYPVDEFEVAHFVRLD